ncbi:hypothetical protein TWF694_010086 [Orbilia ellipsospora]|uniref:C3H1-type domain-containing protein n=1 Tax=Orbilia ellipsospora TaxID=2528407 RepID=A0AAV9X9U1_9PEZI
MSSRNRPVVCRHFAKGSCVMGNDCRFSHDVTLPKSVKVITVDLETLLGRTNIQRERHITLPQGAQVDGIAYEKYQHPTTPPAQVLSFKDFKSYSKSRLIPGITHIQFGNGFNVTDEHINDLLASPHILTNLEVFIIKGIDKSVTITRAKKGRKNSKTRGPAVTTEAQPIKISNEPMLNLISKSPNLKVLHLIGCINVDDFAFRQILRSCPHIHHIKITGTPTQAGSLSTASVLYLLNRGEGLAQDLGELDLVNQKIDNRAVTVLSDTRTRINIIEGLQCELEKGGRGLSLTDTKGTTIHKSGYIIGRDGVAFTYQGCFLPEWEKDFSEGTEQILTGGEGPPGFWSDDENEEFDGSLLSSGQFMHRGKSVEYIIEETDTPSKEDLSGNREISEVVASMMRDLQKFKRTELENGGSQEEEPGRFEELE